MKTALGIVLLTGEIALIDVEDAHLARLSWELWKRPDGTAYVRKRGCLRAASFTDVPPLLHRAVMSAKTGQLVDHINGNTLDNRRCNLRIATPAQNAHNRTSEARNRGSPYLGVTWHRRRGRWTASIRVGGRLHYLGLFEDIEDARRTRAEAERRLWGIEPRRRKELTTN